MPRVATAIPAENQPITRRVLCSHTSSAFACSTLASVSAATACVSVDIPNLSLLGRITQFRPTLFHQWDGLMIIWLHEDVVAGKQEGLFRFGKKAGAYGVSGELLEFVARKVLPGVGEQVFAGHVGAEERRVV